jgi:hypothetical protein
VSRVSGFLKFVLVAGVLIYLFGGRITSFNDSYEERFCKSYNQWNKYAWAVRNNDSSIESNGNWQKLEFEEFSNLQKLVANNDPELSAQISKFADQWFKDSSVGDQENGSIMAGLLIVECEKVGIKIDEDYLRD